MNNKCNNVELYSCIAQVVNAYKIIRSHLDTAIKYNLIHNHDLYEVNLEFDNSDTGYLMFQNPNLYLINSTTNTCTLFSSPEISLLGYEFLLFRLISSDHPRSFPPNTFISFDKDISIKQSYNKKDLINIFEYKYDREEILTTYYIEPENSKIINPVAEKIFDAHVQDLCTIIKNVLNDHPEQHLLMLEFVNEEYIKDKACSIRNIDSNQDIKKQICLETFQLIYELSSSGDLCTHSFIPF